MNNKNKNLDDVLKEIEDSEPDINPDNLSSHTCDSCGARMTVKEYENFESSCEECVYSETSGLIDDMVEVELE